MSMVEKGMNPLTLGTCPSHFSLLEFLWPWNWTMPFALPPLMRALFFICQPAPLPPSDQEDDDGVLDPVKVHLLSLADDPSTGPELSLMCRNIASDDDALARSSVDLLLSNLWTPPPSTTRGPLTAVRPPTTQGNRSTQERQRRAYRFKRYQELYAKNKASLANLISKGLEPGLPARVLTVEDISAHYHEVFAGASPRDDDHVTDSKDPTPGLYLPLMEADIRTAIADRRASNSAGPDGVAASSLRGLPVRGVTALYNAMLLLGYIPSTLKACKTTLIPKDGADPANVGSWRPITVANILVRTMHRLVSARMSTLPLHPSQRGFVSLDGTMANSLLLQAAVKSCRSASRPYTITSLDLKKAFDTVPHVSIARALRRFNVDEGLSRFVMEGLTGCSTVVTVGDASTGDPQRRQAGGPTFPPAV